MVPPYRAKLIYYQGWLQREIDKRLKSEGEGEGGQRQQLAIRKKDIFFK